MSKPEKHFYEFGPFRLDPAERLLLREDLPVPLTPKAFDTLVVLVEQSGHLVGKDELMREVWGDNFVEENNLDKSISALRKALGKDSAKYIATVRGSGYRFTGNVHESTEAESVVLHERTRTRILIEDAKDDEDESIPAQKIIGAESQVMRQELAAAQTPRTNRKWPLVALIVCSILLGLTGIVFVVRTLRGSSATPSQPESRAKHALPSQPKTLAVLPFKPLVANERDESLEMGMADTLITRLGNLHEIVVLPTSAVRKYTGLQQDAAAAGRELSVDSVLDGNIQKAGDQLRVTARLVRVSDGATIWADKFDTKFQDIFAVQDSISERVAGALAVKLSGEEKKGLSKRYTESVEAYQLYLKGYHHWSTFGQTELQTSINYYNEALKKDPNYALAYSGIANTYSVIGIYGPLPAGEAMPMSREAAQRALELDENLAEAHVALGAVKIFYEWDWPGAEREFKRALEIDPNNAGAHNLYGYYFQAMGRGDDAVVEMKRAKELAPEWRIPNRDYLLALFSARRYDEAIEQSRQVVRLDPNDYFAYCILGQSLTQQGRYEEAMAELGRSVSVPGQQPSVRALTELGYFYAVTGKKGEALKIIEQLKEKAKPSTPFQVAEVYAGLGDKDQAFAWLDRSSEERFAFTWKIVITPQFDSLRSDPRYVALLRRMNLSP